MSCLLCFLRPAIEDDESHAVQSPQQLSASDADGRRLVSAKVSLSFTEGPRSKVAESLEAMQQAGLLMPHIDVSTVEASQLVHDVHALRWVGQGSQGIVYEGIWQGATVAVKFSVVPQLDTGAAELLFSRLLGHPNVVQTYNAKVAILDAQICQEAEAATDSSKVELQGGSRTTTSDTVDPRSDSFRSEEGFGSPYGRHSSFNDVRDMLRIIGAKPGQCITQMIMEYCDQGSLLTAISRGIFMPNSRFGQKVALRALLRTAREISQGMFHLHQANVCHGDLKPANVLLMNSRKDRRGFIAKISDFGLSQYCPVASGVVENAPWGTLVFMAPERFCSNRLEPASDVWSLGVIMWQMFTARLPYEGATQAKLVQGIIQGTLHLTWPPNSPAVLVNLVSECMARQPKDRPTFEQLINKLAATENEVRMEGWRLSNSIEIPARPGADGAAAGGAGGSGGSQYVSTRRRVVGGGKVGDIGVVLGAGQCRPGMVGSGGGAGASAPFRTDSSVYPGGAGGAAGGGASSGAQLIPAVRAGAPPTATPLAAAAPGIAAHVAAAAATAALLQPSDSKPSDNSTFAYDTTSTLSGSPAVGSPFGYGESSRGPRGVQNGPWARHASYSFGPADDAALKELQAEEVAKQSSSQAQGEATQNSNDAWRRRSAEPSSWRARSPLSVGPAAPSGMATPPQNEWGAHAQSKRAVVMSRFGLTLRE